MNFQGNSANDSADQKANSNVSVSIKRGLRTVDCGLGVKHGLGTKRGLSIK